MLDLDCTTRRCVVPDCENVHLARGFCCFHYHVWYRGGDPWTTHKNVIDPVARFWAKVDRSGGPDACWPWIACRDARGYGRLSADGKARIAHRMAWMLTHGPIPPGMFVCHHCDNPPCCNPYRCLFLGTPADNAADCVAKGRQVSPVGQDNGMVRNPDRHWSRLYPNMLSGSRSPHAILSEEDVIEIRLRYAAGGVTFVALGREFGVKGSTISQAVRRLTWSHI